MTATEHDPTGIPIPHDLHLTVTTPRGAQANFQKRGSEGKVLKPVDMSTARCRLRGIEIDLRDYLAKLTEALASEDVLRFPSGRLGAGDYDRSVEAMHEFQPGEMQLDSVDMESLKIVLDYRVSLYRPPIVSRFEVESRGRVIQLAPVTVPEGAIFRMGIVEGPGSISPIIGVEKHPG